MIEFLVNFTVDALLSSLILWLAAKITGVDLEYKTA